MVTMTRIKHLLLNLHLFNKTENKTLKHTKGITKLDWESIRSSLRDGFGVVGTLSFGD